MLCYSMVWYGMVWFDAMFMSCCIESAPNVFGRCSDGACSGFQCGIQAWSVVCNVPYALATVVIATGLKDAKEQWHRSKTTN